MYRDYRYGCGIVLVALLFLLAACGGTGSTPSPARSVPTVQSGTAAAASTAGTGPIVVLSPTSAVGGTGTTSASQQTIKLADRTLTIGQVSKQAGADGSSTAISITVIVTNATSNAIQNKPTFYQLVGSEGDAFGAQSSVTPGFYGPVGAKQSRRGTITFQVPTAAVQGLQLLYRPEIATETVLASLPK